MGYSYTKYKGPDVPTLIIPNHNSNIDAAMVALCFSRHMYFLSSEHALRNGLPSKLIKAVFSPISFNKTQTDVRAIKEMMRRLKAGANVCLFAEGDRSYSGRTCPIGISAAKLAKKSGADMMTFRLEGGYFTTPRWSMTRRKGKMTGAVVRRYTAAELKGMTDQEVLDAIERDIHEDSYALQRERQISYKGKNLAESIEAALYICPKCKRIGTIVSSGDHFSCDCGLSGEYADTGFLIGETLPYSTITEWFDWQETEIREIVGRSADGPICSDTGQQLYSVRPGVDKTLAAEGDMWISREVFHCAGLEVPLGEIISFVTVGQMELLFSLMDGSMYEVRSHVPRSALKYKDIFRLLKGNGGVFLQ